MKCSDRWASARNAGRRRTRRQSRPTETTDATEPPRASARRGSGSACSPSRASWPARIGGTRRLNGLIARMRTAAARARAHRTRSAEIAQLARKIDDLNHLAAFALPIMRTIAAWPVQATWAEWLDHFDALAPRVLLRPDRVLRVLADLRPMGAVGPVTLDEAARVSPIGWRASKPSRPLRRYGRVLVASPAQLRGRSLRRRVHPGAGGADVSAEAARGSAAARRGAAAARRRAAAAGRTRAELENCSCGLRSARPSHDLYVSFPTVEIGEGRPRVPSLYALEVWRAMTGRVPSADELQQAAARASQATLAWPAPADRDEAIDALEHDLSTLRALDGEPDATRARPRALHPAAERIAATLRSRAVHARQAGWSHWDGITSATERVKPILAGHRLGARRYSLSALQKYAVCPYQFLLSAIYRLRPAEDLEPLQRMDPLTRGSLFHEMQTAFYRQLAGRGRSSGDGVGTRLTRWRFSTRWSNGIARTAVRAPRAGDRSRVARRDRRASPRPAFVGRRDRPRSCLVCWCSSMRLIEPCS